MKKHLALISLLLPVTGVFDALAQTKLDQLYYTQNNVRVIENGNFKTAAWSGGVNTPQLAMADLNKDGKEDLVIYEDWIGVKTYINKGGSTAVYEYDGSYEGNFPKDLRGFVKLIDFNRDGIKDLIHRGGPGFYIYWGYYNERNHLVFDDFMSRWQRAQKGVYYYKDNGWVNAYCDPMDIPEVIDWDNDGDYDLLGYTIGGNRIGLYKNCQKENHLPNDSIDFCYMSSGWGRFIQNYERAVILADTASDKSGTTCKGCGTGSGNKTTHTGNTICLLDYDGDSDFDLLNGNISFSDVQFLINGRANLSYSKDTMVAQDSIWGSHGKDVHVDMFPAIFNIDLDQDGKKDLVFAPHAPLFENYKSIIFYKNIGSNSNPVFEYQTSTYLVDQMIDLGINSRPVFYDYNKDGKQDLFIGSDGIYQPDGTLKTQISYYENISDPGYPTYKLITNDFLHLGSNSLQGASLAFGDVDNDTLDDMIIGQGDGTLLFFKNSAANNNVQPVWAQPSGSPYVTYKSFAGTDEKIDIGKGAAPVLYDLNKDGKKDLIIGTANGYLHYYENGGTISGQIALDSITDTLGDIRIKQPGYSTTYPVPYFGRIDDTQKEYLVIGTQTGDILVYDSFQNGSLKSYKLVESKYQYIFAGPRSAPAIADVDGDGLQEMLVGGELGGVNLYRQLWKAGIDDDRLAERLQVKVYPNPAKDVLNFVLPEGFRATGISVSLINATGQRVAHMPVADGQKHIQLSIGDIPAGIYYSVVQSADDRAINPVTILK